MNPITGLALGRIAVGIASLVKPDVLGSGMGQQNSSSLIAQWFGAREIALGLVTLTATGSARRNLVLVGAGVDAADATTAFLAIQRGELAKPVGLGLTAMAAGAVVAGLVGLRQKKK